MELESKVAIVTGSSANIGRAIALEFARHGARVVVHARANRAGGEAVADEIRSAGGEAAFVQADLSDPSQVERLFAATRKAFGGVDILVNNAGAATAAPFLEADKQHWLEAFDANFFSAVLCSIQAARVMLARGAGKIINTASIRGLPHVGRPGIMAY
ncbi:MAG: SDR family NAD(P)-dependent oxidoreductase, partial [Desulfobacterales bacterium]|nr:SDR family NAD(P)-dependent oxidoreductase [Desulfobacterales bacterium]